MSLEEPVIILEVGSLTRALRKSVKFIDRNSSNMEIVHNSL